MLQQNIRKQIIIAYVISGIFLFIALFGHMIDVHLGVNYIVSSLFVIILFISMIAYYIKSISLILKNQQDLSLRLATPTIIYSASWVLLFLSPYLNIDNAGKPVITGIYRGTQNQAIVIFRDDHFFDLNWTGVYGYNIWYTGKYATKGDTLLLKYDQNTTPVGLGSVILNKNGSLTSLDLTKDATKHYVPFTIAKPEKK